MKSRSAVKRQKMFWLPPKGYRTLVTQGPEWLLALYNIDQDQLTALLQNKEVRNYLANYRYNGQKLSKKISKTDEGKIWQEFLHHFGNILKGKIPNAGWHFRMLADNLVNLIKSYTNNAAVYQLLKANNNKIDKKFWQQIDEQGLYTRSNLLKNYQDSDKDELPFPDHKRFVMDFSISDKQFFRFDSDTLECSIHIYSHQEAKKRGLSKEEEWRPFKLYLLPYIREQFKGKVAKPQFVKMHHEEKLLCCIPYEVAPIRHQDFDNILGIDLGKVKPYSATAIYHDGQISNEYVPSREIMRIQRKIRKINRHLNCLYAKRKDKATPSTVRQKRRAVDIYNDKQKRTRLKEKYAWLIANEVVQVAIAEHCFLIKLENLSWLRSQGGKWNFNEIQERIKELAYLNGISVRNVNPAYTSEEHPFTKEKGKPSGRKIIFNDGTWYDRDNLADINIAARKPRGKKNKKIHLRHKQTVRVHRHSRRKHNLLTKKEALIALNKKSQRIHQIVVFCSNQLRELNVSACLGFVNNLLPRKYFVCSKVTSYYDLCQLLQH